MDASGTWYLTADSQAGPWSVPRNPLLIGSGRGRHDHYVGRTIAYEGQRLLYHQTWGNGTVSWATPKLIVQDEEKRLHLRYWPQLDTLKTRCIADIESIRVQADQDMNAF